MNNIIEFNIELLIDEYSNYVFKIVDNIAGSSLSYEDKEEIISDTFYLLWKNQTLIKKNLKSYLASIARHCTIRKLKNMKPTYKLNEDVFQINFQYEQLDDLLAMKEKLKKLSTSETQIFRLYYLDGMKIKEIAKILKCSSSNIKIKLFRIRKKLKEEIL